MVTCSHIRKELLLDATSADSEVQEHIRSCPACAAYARKHEQLDNAIRCELRWEVPSDLTANLLAMTLSQAAFAAALSPQPKRWHVICAYIATTASILLSLLIGWQVFELVAAQVDVQAQITQAMALPGQWVAQLTQSLPQSRYVVDFAMRAHTQLLWLLMAAFVWAILDKWNPQQAIQQRQSA